MQDIINNTQPRENTAFVSLQNIEKVYPNGAKAVYNFDLDIKENEFVVIVGPSGCGKSTTLRMIAGLETISSGRLFIGGEYSNYKSSKDRKMAMVFQSYALYPQMSVFDNIAFPLKINKYKLPKTDKSMLVATQIIERLSTEKLEETKKTVQAAKTESADATAYISSRLSVKNAVAGKLKKLDLNSADEVAAAIAEAETEREKLRGKYREKGLDICDDGLVLKDGEKIIEETLLDKEEIFERVFRAASVLDLGPYLDRLPRQLSGGQMQRVALGRAIVKEVPLFLMDEPLSNLDAKLRLTMRSEIVKLHRRLGTTTVYVTHDQTEAMTMATRVVVMSKGFVQQIDTPAQIYNNPCNVFVANFIGSPSINMFEGTFDGENILFDGGVKIPVGAERCEQIARRYSQTEEELTACISGFDDAEQSKASSELIKKMQSANSVSVHAVAAPKKSLIAKIKALFKKKDKTEEKIIPEKSVAEEMLVGLKFNRTNPHRILLGVRPENITVVKATGKALQNAVTTEVSVSELLGSEYNIHFDLFGKDFVAKVPVKDSFEPGDKVAVTFSAEDILAFDKITGGRLF